MTRRNALLDQLTWKCWLHTQMHGVSKQLLLFLLVVLMFHLNEVWIFDFDSSQVHRSSELPRLGHSAVAEVQEPESSVYFELFLMEFYPMNFHRSIESYSTEGGHSAFRACTDNNPTQALSPKPHIFTPLIPLTYTSRDTKGAI